MTPETWQRLQKLFERAVDLDPDARGLLLDDLKTEEPELAEELVAMLEADEEASPSSTGASALGQAVRRFACDAIEDRDAIEDHDAIENRPPPPRIESRGITRLGPYLLERPLGRGGMATVYRARRADGAYEQLVAIKILEVITPQVSQRFRTERQILAQLDHPNIVRLLDGGETADGILYAVLEYVEGEPIHQFCQRRGLNLARRLELFRAVCSAVHHTHRHGIVHRDLKPANILVTSDRVPKVLDFGIAKALEEAHLPGGLARTEPGMRLLTPAYASPEQNRGEAVTPASDLYALGLVLHTLLTDERPPSAKEADAEGRLEQARRRLRQTSTPRWLVKVVEKALAPAATERYASAQALADALLPSLRSGVTRIGTGLATAAMLAILLAAFWFAPWRRDPAPAVETLAALVERRGEWATERARPPHDIRPARDRLKSAMATVEESLGDLEPALRSLALAELGGAHLAIGELEPARDRLREAREAGKRTREVNRDLAVALGLIELASPNADPSEPSASVAAARDALRRSLDGGGHESGAGAYLNTLLAALEGGTEAVRLHAALAVGTAWEAEARLLEARLLERRRNPTAAAEAYAAVTRAAPSDPRGHLGRCLLALGPTQAEDQVGAVTVDNALAEAGMAACQRAVGIDPEDPAAQAALSRSLDLGILHKGER